MNNDKMYMINKLFKGKTIRTVWNKEDEKYYVSVVDVVGALTGSSRPRKYWSDLKKILKNDGFEVSDKIGQLKLNIDLTIFKSYKVYLRRFVSSFLFVFDKFMWN